ncbi:hypothetical protein AVEN_211968-1 [Araneus ventricosus]|uniref:Uncharacterized protein n=1 Tax=Araneus ventricosus TaxID=182803 RepID=A0A4Y2FWJ4_ARAVE|nr:hypothetical protein AVEN_211968-1 [Araneus ventricosus]
MLLSVNFRSTRRIMTTFHYSGGSKSKETSPLREKTYSRNQGDRGRNSLVHIEALGPSVHKFIETDIEEIRVEVAEPLNDCFLDISICSKMATVPGASSTVRRDENHLVRDPGCREGVVFSVEINAFAPFPQSWPLFS